MYFFNMKQLLTFNNDDDIYNFLNIFFAYSITFCHKIKLPFKFILVVFYALFLLLAYYINNVFIALCYQENKVFFFKWKINIYSYNN